VAYSVYGMVQPRLKPLPASRPADGAIGFVNGILGGMTGLTGPILVIWCQLSGVPRHAQRAIFQPVILAAFLMTAVALGVDRAITRDVVVLFVLGLLPVASGIWLGVHLYGRLDEVGFRRVILWLLFLSGLVLLVPGWG